MNNRNYACLDCRTVQRAESHRNVPCRLCEKPMRLIGQPPKRGDDAAWESLTAEIRERDIARADWEWRKDLASSKS